MFTKEIAITLPLMILLYEFSFLKTKRNLNWKLSCPFLAYSIYYSLNHVVYQVSKFQEIQDVAVGLEAFLLCIIF